MSSIVCVVVHPSRIIREGLTSILAKSPFAPACTAASIEEVPSLIASGGEEMLVLIGVREAIDLADGLQAAKASFPDASVLLIGDAANRDLVMTALALGATSFVDENVASSVLIKELELAAQGEPVISVPVFKRLLVHFSAPPREQALMSRASGNLRPQPRSRRRLWQPYRQRPPHGAMELSEDEQLHPSQHRWTGQSLFQGLWPSGSPPGLPLLRSDPQL